MTANIGTDIGAAARLLESGNLVAFPTETVYGLGADALNPTAVAAIFAAKQRPAFDPLIVHIAEQDWLPRVVTNVPKSAKQLMDAFWPGPLTLILPRLDRVPDLVSSGLPTVGVRLPEHSIARELIRRADRPIAAPSANLFGRLSPTTAAHVAEQLGDRIDYILDGGPSTVGLESTVVAATDQAVHVLRPGGVSIEQLKEVVPAVNFERSNPDRPVSPGQTQVHYAPGTPLVINDRPEELDIEPGTGLLSIGHPVSRDDFAAVEVLSETGDLIECAARFFAALRRLDALGLDLIIAQPFPETGLGVALNDRLQRAAGHQR